MRFQSLSERRRDIAGVRLYYYNGSKTKWPEKIAWPRAIPAGGLHEDDSQGDPSARTHTHTHEATT